MSTASRFLRTARAIQRHGHAGRAELKEFQNVELRRLVRHAYENVLYYRRLFDRHRLHPRHIRGVMDLDLIPITTKQDLRNRPLSEVIARDIDPSSLIAVRTSGSTGEPFVVRRTPLEQGHNVLFRERTYQSFGLHLHERIAAVGRPRERDPKDTKLFGRALRAVGIHPKISLDGMSHPESVANRLAAYRPHLLVGLPGMLCRVADYLLSAGRHEIRPRILVVGGEVLTPLMRRRLTDAFGVAPVQTYASHEFPLMGWECRETGQLHTCDDGVIVEVLHDGRPAAPGRTGEAVVTNLYAYAMPLIRYRLSDVLTRGTEHCGCGRPFGTIAAIQGRMIDYFPLSNGRVVHPYNLLESFLPGIDIRQYQLLQDRPDRIVLSVVPMKPASAELQDRISRSVTPLLGPGIEFQVRMVDDIPLDPTGKFRHSRSLIASAYDNPLMPSGNV
jgi:phenylacetate-CoA ligase